MADRLTHWFMFTVVMGAVPYLVTIAITQLESDAPTRLFPPSPEILFVSLAASASVLGQIRGPRGRVRFRAERAPRPSISQWAMGAALVVSCMLYGAYVLKLVENPGRAAGVECSTLVDGTVRGDASDRALQAAMRDRWGHACERWLRTQDRYFATAVWMALIFTASATIIVAMVPQRRKRWT